MRIELKMKGENKMKTKNKLLVVLAIVVLAMFAFCANTVIATEETVHTETTVNLDKLPDTIEVKMLSTQAIENAINMSGDLILVIEDAVKEATRRDIDTDYNINIQFNTVAGLTDISTVDVKLYDKSYKEVIDEKMITIGYTDAKWNKEDKDYIAKKFEGVEELTDDIYVEIDGTGFDELEDFLKTEFNRIINDSSIGIALEITKASWDWPELYVRANIELRKNGVLYYTIGGVFFANPLIKVPSDVEDTEEAIIEYCCSKIDERYKRIYLDNYSIDYTFVKGEKENEYIFTIEDSAKYTVTVKKAVNTSTNTNTTKPTIDLTDETTNVKFNASFGIVPSNTLLEVSEIKEGAIFEKVKSALSQITKFIAFDITLKSDDEKIQPNGKVKISIPIPNEFDKENLVVYRIEDDGNKIEYAVTVEGEYATFETDHFSNYVLAEMAEEVLQVTKKLDEEPKTGEENYVVLASFIAVVSFAGMIVMRKQEND